MANIAKDQADLKENAQQIIQQLMEVGKKSFFVSPQMSQMMADMMENMDRSIEQMEERNTRNAGQAQQRAMSNMNQAIMSMQNSMNQMMQASSASGFQEYMEMLQQMAGQQGQMNQNSMSLFQQQQGGEGQDGQQQGRKPSPQAMARLAAQQQMIRESLEKLGEQMGNRRDVLGRMDEMGEEMDKVIDDLRKNKLDRKVIERQQRILSRLLDAQKSVREREYSKKRLAEREDTGTSTSPAPLKDEILKRENQLRKEMLNSMKEGYSPEYKEVIKSYDEILSRQPQMNQ